MRRAALLALLCAACGQGIEPLQAVDLPTPSIVRCTVDTLPDGWECCSDGGLLCSGTFLVCQAHHWVPLTDERCTQLAADPARAELQTYGNLCERTASGDWLSCPSDLRNP